MNQNCIYFVKFYFSFQMWDKPLKSLKEKKLTNIKVKVALLAVISNYALEFYSLSNLVKIEDSYDWIAL